MSRDSVVRVGSIGAEVRIDVHLDLGEQRLAREMPPPAPSTRAPPAMTQRTLLAGRVVGGRYELVRLLGRGSMGTVWLAHHTTLGERVALKLMDPTAEAVTAEDASTTAARFRFEAQIAARLSRKTHHVVRVTDHGQDGPLPYLVMELLEGQTLEQALLAGPMGLAEASELVTQIARGLHAAHAEGILHRDLKPANVFLANVGEGRAIVKLLDFGVAWGQGAQRLGAPFATARGLVVGTPGYMSPEQAAASALDVRSDVWALAAIAYEAITGALPVVGVDADHMLSNLRACRTVPLRHRRPDLPAALDRVFERAFAPHIDARHSTCAELAHDFEQAARVDAAPIVVSAPPRDAPARTRTHARRVAFALLASAALAGALCASRIPWRRQGAGRMAVHAATGGGAAGAAARAEVRAPAPTPASSLGTQSASPAPVVTPLRSDPRPAFVDLGEFKSHY